MQIAHFMQTVAKETICMKCQILFSGKNKKNIINLSSAEFANWVINVKLYYINYILVNNHSKITTLTKRRNLLKHIFSQLYYIFPKYLDSHVQGNTVDLDQTSPKTTLFDILGLH